LGSNARSQYGFFKAYNASGTHCSFQTADFYSRFIVDLRIAGIHWHDLHVTLYSGKGAILMQLIIGNALVYLGIAFIAFGVIGIYRFSHFYPRILVASKVDTVGFLTLMFGVIVRSGFSIFSLKVGLLVVITMFINPLITHSIARSAYYSGYKIRKE
jgi:multicomponent Na+:H+ antiporter subunit G